MIRRISIALALLVAAALLLPPLWYAVFRETPPELPPPGRRVVLETGVAVNVVEAGSGPAVVLVHGLPGCAYDWRELSSALAERGLRAIAYDRVGYGYSDARPAGTPFTAEQNAVELVALLDALDVRDATVVGWSFGGATTMLAVRRSPTRIGRIALVGSAGPGIEDQGPPPLPVRVMFSAPVLAWVAWVPPAARGLRALSSDAAYSGQPQPDWWMPTLDANFGRPHTPATYRMEGRSFAGAPPDTTGLSLPILVFHGEDDLFAPVAIAHELARRAPHSKLVVVEGGSHMLPITHAGRLADEIAALKGG
jgi:pimeloyl-ACP methyl ester carboxylesterase